MQYAHLCYLVHDAIACILKRSSSDRATAFEQELDLLVVASLNCDVKGAQIEGLTFYWTCPIRPSQLARGDVRKWLHLVNVSSTEYR